MAHTTIAAQLRAAREKRQWSLANLGRVVEIPKPRLSQFENEHRHPNEQEWERLRSALNLGPYHQPVRLELPVARRVWTTPDPDTHGPAERSFSTRLFAARKSFGMSSVQKTLGEVRARADWALCERFLQQASLESGHECLFWLKVLAGGANPCRMSPSKAGFRRLPVIDYKSKATLGDLRFPCLDLDGAGYDCLLFPQVTLATRKGCFRLDALACLRSAHTRCWVDLEIDGQGHVSQFDLERQDLLALPTVRLNSSDLSSADLLDLLDQKLTPLLGSARTG